MRNKLKNLVIVNIFSIIIFIICLIMIFCLDNMAIWIVTSILWLLYTIFANKYVLTDDKQESLRDTFAKSNKGLFDREVTILKNQYDSIKSREEFMNSSTESMQELYYKILEQAESNLESASAYMASYDYYTKPEPTYLKKLITEGNDLVQKFNTLVEKLVDIDTNPTTLDVKYVEDITTSLDQMKEYNKVMMS